MKPILPDPRKAVRVRVTVPVLGERSLVLTPAQRAVVAVLAAVEELRASRTWPDPPGTPVVDCGRATYVPTRVSAAGAPGVYTVQTLAAQSLARESVVEFPIERGPDGQSRYGLPRLTRDVGRAVAAAVDRDVAAVGLRPKSSGA